MPHLQLSLKRATQKIPRPRALIIEDDLTQEPIWEHILKNVQVDMRYDWVTDVQAAEKLLREPTAFSRPYDLIISDIYLSSNLTGIDLWSRYAHEFGSKILLVSGINYTKLVKKLGPQVPTPMYIQKPLRVHECVETIHSMLYDR